MNRWGRITAVILGLIATGAACGAMAGAVALTTSLWLSKDPSFAMGLELGAFFGAPLGAIMAPLLALLLLRRVPLGQVFVWLSSGTAIGGVVGWTTAVASMDAMVVAGLGGAVIGCLVAAIRLRYRVRRLEA